MIKLRIVDSKPYCITIAVGPKTMRVGCEAFQRGSGSPDFVIYKNTIENWDPPFDIEVIDDAMRHRIVDELTKVMTNEMQWSVQVE